MLNEQDILDQLNIKNNLELCRILNDNLPNTNITINFKLDHNYYRISGTFCIDPEFWKLKNTILVKSKNTKGNKNEIKRRKDELIKARNFEIYKDLCHRGHLIAKQFEPYIEYSDFNFSKNNPDNIYPQWINANLNNLNHSGIFGQAYFEDKVLNWLEQGDEVLYKVVPIFEEDTEDYPIGNVIIAFNYKDKEKIINIENSSERFINYDFDEEETNKFCVFIPNYLDTDVVLVKKKK